MIPEAFRVDLVALINRHSVEQCGDIPDYILAQHICDHIDVLHRTLKVRDKWFGVEHRLPMGPVAICVLCSSGSHDPSAHKEQS